MSKKQKKFKHLPEKIEKKFELPAGTLRNIAQVEIAGNHRITVVGCKGILEYSDDTVRLNTDSGVIRVLGVGLSMNCLTDESTVVEGKIISVEYL